MRSVLETDGYKFSMAEAGWPLRRETFYYAHRSGGPQVLPVDVAAFVRALLPTIAAGELEFLGKHGYELGGGFRAAISRGAELRIDALPKGAVFYPGEPVFSVTGPSALVSWLEPLALQLHFRIQVASIARFEPEKLPQVLATATCEAERALVQETLDAVNLGAPAIRVDADGYRARVQAMAASLVSVAGDSSRVFEVGLRAASCSEQHALALEGCLAGGITRTSHVLGAQRLGMLPVGTMGHEHIQRYGSDAAAFRAMHDRRPERSSYLLDTYDTLEQGLPAAYALMLEDPPRGDSIRFDSGDKGAQLRVAVERARAVGLDPVYILEDGLDVEATRALEGIRNALGVPANRVFYGYGGQLVSRTSGSPLTRDRVSAVWKLCETANTPTMKFANASGEGKQSLPGRPVVWRRVSGGGPIGIIAQASEKPRDGYVRLTNAERDVTAPELSSKVEGSVETKALVEALRAKHFAPGHR